MRACVPRRLARRQGTHTAAGLGLRRAPRSPAAAPSTRPSLASPPPLAGKTLLARAVAHHTDCTFIRVSGGELVQKYIGEGSRMVRELFVMAR